MKFTHEDQRNYAGNPWRHIWLLAGKSWCVGFGLIVERTPLRTLRLVKILRGPKGTVVWFWRIGFGLRVKALNP